jgi:hypothetical protein
MRSVNRRKLREVLDAAMSDAKQLSADMRSVNIEIDPMSML